MLGEDRDRLVVQADIEGAVPKKKPERDFWRAREKERALDDEDVDDEVGTRERRESLRKKRHYKKDSRFLLDLYTLTFDEHETVDEIATCKTRIISTGENDFVSLAISSSSTPVSPHLSRAASFSAAPSSQDFSLGITNALAVAKPSRTTTAIPSLETNLHKILARKFQDSEEVSFKKAKLLTKAYYQLLRTNNSDVVAASETSKRDAFQSLAFTPGVFRKQKSTSALLSKPIRMSPRDDRLSWPALLRANNTDLGRMAAGLSNTVAALNEYLVDLLLERDEMLSQQDDMLEQISELTDSLLS